MVEKRGQVTKVRYNMLLMTNIIQCRIRFRMMHGKKAFKIMKFTHTLLVSLFILENGHFLFF
ncbi:hypothetical protein AWI62_06585 [Salmonella enterica]|nr:hypothetical protein [Salmonella enterica]